MEFEFNFGRRETAAERLERERAETARRRTEGLLGALFGGRASSVPAEVPVIMRTTVIEDSVFGQERSERTKTLILKLKPGTTLGKTEDEATVFGRKVTTVVIEGLEAYNLPITTETSETDTVFGTTYTTTVRIQSQVEQALNAARDNTPRTERVTIRVRRPNRPM